MKAIRIPVFVLAVLLAFSVCNAVHLTRRCALWQAELAEADRAAAMGDTEAAGAALARLEALWQADQGICTSWCPTRTSTTRRRFCSGPRCCAA